MATNREAVRRWVKRIHKPGLPEISSERIISDGDRIYSFGRHFELARVLRDEAGKPIAIIANGDTYSQTTTRHQEALRSALAISSLTPSAIIPHAAIAGAGIDIDTIRPIETLPDGFRETRDYLTDEDAKAFSPDGPWFTRRWFRGLGNRSIGGASLETRLAMAISPREPGDHHQRLPIRGIVAKRHMRQDDHGRWYVKGSRHMLGACLFTAEVVTTERRWAMVDGRRKLLDETFTRRRHKFLSDWDMNETQPLYFLCQLPRTGARTVADAIEALKPQAVIDAEKAGLVVLRQGDVFAIPTELTDAEIAAMGGKIRHGFGTPAKLDRPAYDAAVDAYDDAVHAWKLRGPNRYRLAHWAFGWNRDSGNPYFSVHSWTSSRGPYVHDPSPRSPEPSDYEIVPRGKPVFVLSTTHTATRVARVGRVWYGKGTLRHMPDGRPPDHAMLALDDGKRWYRFVRNTVPRIRRTRKTTTMPLSELDV